MPKYPVGALLRYNYHDGTKPEPSYVICKVAGYKENWKNEVCYDILWFNSASRTLSTIQSVWWIEKNYIDISSKLAKLFYL